ncbi:MAG TPA: DUF4390 domain-containing protein [Candidatus Polarisedimenticolia bacterium]|nr:DUF4390 domain-containing protein [Candidatus Polarisedimenticolia bacterium]
MSHPIRGLIVLLTALAGSLWLDGAPLHPAGGPASVGSIETSATAHDLYASFSVRDAFDEDVRERLASGLPVEFTHYVEVARRRALWFDKTVLRKTITTTVTFDTLTRQYSLSKKVNDEVAETSVAVNEADMERWMTRLDQVRLGDPALMEGLEEGSLYIRVKSRLVRRFVLLFIPWDVETGWERVKVSLRSEVTGSAR